MTVLNKIPYYNWNKNMSVMLENLQVKNILNNINYLTKDNESYKSPITYSYFGIKDNPIGIKISNYSTT